ncbi:unnamed protein product [Rotaria socialis]|uniref:Transmembrane protein n=1 Tax=Rotaria socialis TaxID=392032 RepID=A0A820A078_9BILA|nr:unnamed protein product [Rotaria socialis]CAF3187505.1 unnamed protein product [Rotaria socialis]CAF3301486.1 unnamed protein product [Rotaria socialis]CAF3416336.1 unnamed protein product [Rotaria socialis]CAF3482845.1 unnamed protein product [Rotaria socialis]
MNDSTGYNGRSRPRAQSLFEYRSQTNAEITVALFDRLIASQDTSSASNETTDCSDQSDIIIRTGLRRTIFFITQPIIAGFFIFPLLILFWQAGWNFMVVWLETPTNQHWIVLVMLYFLAQFIFLFIYLNQDHLYDYLHKKKLNIFISLVVQCHNFIVSSTYIIQWVSMWTVWDRYTPADWLLMLTISIAALLTVIGLMGHPCDLVCAPFILSYDSVEYNIRIGSPFLTKNISECFAHFLNYMFYEYIISLLSILAWRGSYTLLDVFLFPKNPLMSAVSSLFLGYPLYFLLMYTQSSMKKLCQLPTITYLNYPSLICNIRHLTAFSACVLLWRGFWLLFDTYIATMTLAIKSPYLFYLICMFISFFILSLLRTASSINGPMSHMFDQYDLFPDYPNCYLVEWFNQMKKIDDTSSKSSKNTRI